LIYLIKINPHKYLFLLIGILFLFACNSDDPGSGQVHVDGSISWDGMYWTDYGTWNQFDWGNNQFDLIAFEDGFGDGQQINDGDVLCPGPPGITCTPFCLTDQLCTAAQEGSCVKRVELIGPAEDKAVLVEVVLAYVECWAKEPEEDSLCVTFDTCQLQGTLTEEMVYNWVCDDAQISDFPSVSNFEAAQEVCGCGITNLYKVEWQINDLAPNQQGIYCLSYNVVSMWYDSMNVDSCSNFTDQ